MKLKIKIGKYNMKLEVSLFTISIILIILKLIGIINWSWFWVFLPMIVSVISGVLFLLTIILIVAYHESKYK